MERESYGCDPNSQMAVGLRQPKTPASRHHRLLRGFLLTFSVLAKGTDFKCIAQCNLTHVCPLDSHPWRLPGGHLSHYHPKVKTIDFCHQNPFCQAFKLHMNGMTQYTLRCLLPRLSKNL